MGVMRKPHTAGTYSCLGEPLDVLGLCITDEVVVKDHIWLQAQHFTSHWQQKKPGIAIGEVIAEKSGVFKMHWLLRETAEVHLQEQNKNYFSFSSANNHP